MPFNWREFIDIAKYLHLHGNSAIIPQKAAFRCAISRAYYAAFGHTKTYVCLLMGFIAKGTEEDHRDLRFFFRKHHHQEISRNLDRLRQWRNNCDYDNPAPVATDSNVTIAIQKAEEVITQLPIP